MSLDLDTIRIRLSRADVPSIIADAFALVGEVERLREEVAYLRACVPPARPSDYGHEAWTETVRAAVGVERAAVVAYLAARGGICLDLANDIERGEHLHAEEP